MAVIEMTTTLPEELREKVTTFDIAPVDGLSQLREEASAIQDMCSDTMLREVSLANLAMYCTNGVIKARYKDSADKEVQVRSFTPYSLGQLCTKLGIPSQYMQKCAKLGYESLVEDNFNAFIDDYGKDLFIREFGSTIRGVLSDRYSVFDTPDVIDVINESTRGLDMRVKSYYISPERFHARLIQTDFMNVAGEDLFAGIQIDSSDVGRSVLSVNFFIFKQICTNGLCVSRGNANLFTQKHIAICTDDFKEELNHSLKLFPELVAEYEATISKARMSSKFIRNAKSLDENAFVQELVMKLKAVTRLSDEGAYKVARLAGTKYDYSDWGIINSITEVAQDYTLERRIELEKIAANMLRIA